MGDSEAAELVALAQGGDRDAHFQLMASHRRIVARLVKQYSRSGLTSEDRIQLGEQGLGLAINKFNLTKGFSFSTYATWWIRQAITTGLGGSD
jgi:RNA polymerase primary sigma factor